MKVSVVLSVYNTGRFLPDAMEALMAQTFRDFEILLIDDGSTDGSGGECERQAAGRERVRVFHKENGGL
ncbi:MAG: glycosyltransferase, partial [Lachnospiraceae bacterium]|nr:glycosyltransferase [Lachnospiraceae bacterium]